jgi:ferredoxin-NADP reductase
LPVKIPAEIEFCKIGPSKPGDDFYRVSIKRESSTDLLWPDGLVSTYFHDKVHVGSEIMVSLTSIDFSVNQGCDGLFSNQKYFLTHSSGHPGNLLNRLQIGMPCGTFVLNEDTTRPIVLIAGGVGLTPMISMLDHIMENEVRQMVYFQNKNPNWIIFLGPWNGKCSYYDHLEYFTAI